LHLTPFVYGIEQKLDMETFKRTYPLVEDKKHQVRFFVRSAPYKMWGLWEMRLHFFGTEDPEAPLFLFGTDMQGRDVFSRCIYGARLSLSIGVMGVAVSFVLGIVIGGASGYLGGVADTVVQRVIEILRSMPGLPLWMALAAALPAEWPVVKVYFFITLILSIRGWTGLARVVRGRFLAMREEEFIIAARTVGATTPAIIARHMVPAFMSHLIASATLSVPGMIIGETSLSFLGVGLAEPAISWGVLLQAAQNVKAVVSVPWLMLPAVFVVVTVLVFNFLGDGLRDAADPYSR
jgi:peptide/nickel transport system permease protein